MISSRCAASIPHDNLGDERVFFRGVEMLAAAGIPPNHLLAYMLVGYDRRETWERVLYRLHGRYCIMPPGS